METCPLLGDIDNDRRCHAAQREELGVHGHGRPFWNDGKEAHSRECGKPKPKIFHSEFPLRRPLSTIEL